MLLRTNHRVLFRCCLSLQSLSESSGTIAIGEKMQHYRREAAHAGSWYPSEALTLERSLARWLGQARTQRHDVSLDVDPDLFPSFSKQSKEDGSFFGDKLGNHRAHDEQEVRQRILKANDERTQLGLLIVPHAGYAYSGETAAYAYAQVDPDRFNRVVILGPSHHVYMRSCGLTGADRLATPLGDLSVDTSLIQDWITQHPDLFQRISKQVDEDEHSLEMQLPFLAYIFRKRPVRVVPVMCGALSISKEQECGRFFAKVLEERGTLLIISTDFCHWGRRFRYTRGCGDEAYRLRHEKALPLHQYIRALDSTGMRLIASKDAEAFGEYLQETGNTICGRHPLSVLLWALQDVAFPPCWRIEFLHYAQSSACTDEQDSSVSYVAGVGFGGVV
jgi:AmmeMemoRadiSam system protein B